MIINVPHMQRYHSEPYYEEQNTENLVDVD